MRTNKLITSKRVRLGLAALTGILFTAFQLSPGSAPVVYAAPASFVVTNTNDSGAGSLRQAILSANGNGNPSDQDTITFSINGDAPGDVVIEPLTPLSITQSVLIDGYTQGDAVQNSTVWPQPFDNTLRLAIDNSTSGSIQVTGNNVTLKGLVIYNQDETTPEPNVTVTGTSGFKLFGSYLGTQNNGLLPAKNGPVYVDARKSLVISDSTGARIGSASAAERNLFGYCAFSCIEVSGSGSSDIIMRGNYVGLGTDGVTSLNDSFSVGPYEQSVVIKDGVQGVTIGGDQAGQGNSIEHSSHGALLAQDSNNVSVLGNRILFNFDNSSGVTFSGVTNSTIGSAGGGKNIFSGNTAYALLVNESPITSDPSTNITVQNNNFGVMGDNTTAFPNGQNILVGGDSQEILVTENIIHNSAPNAYAPSLGWDGIQVYGDTQVSILGNSIYNNKLRGISLYGTNPLDPLDTDTGPNDGLNTPGYTSIVEDGGSTEVTFTMDVPAGDYRVEFFSNDVADPDYSGEGKTFIGFADVTSTGTGNQEFFHTLSGIGHDNLALTATERNMDTASTFGATSQFGTEGEPYIPEIDLSVDSNLDNPEDVALAGNTAEISITITNNGPDSLNLDTLNDPSPSSNFLFMTLLPDSLSYSSISGSGIACNDMGPGSAGDVGFGGQFQNHTDFSVVTCAYTGGSSILAAGQSRTFVLSATVMTTQASSIPIYTIANATTSEPDYTAYQNVINSGNDIIENFPGSGTNNFAVIDFNHTYVSDLSVTKKLLNPQDYAIGNTLNYEVKITNNGPDMADLGLLNDPTPGQGTELFTDILPPNLAFSAISGPSMTCLDLGAGSAILYGPVLGNHSDHSLVTCASTGGDKTLDSGESLTVTFSASVLDDTEPIFYNHVLVAPLFNDPDGDAFFTIATSGEDILDGMNATPLNNHAQAYSQPADISISKTLNNPQNVAPGATLNYTVSLTNNGPSSINPNVFDLGGFNPLATALFVDIMPPNLTYVSQSNTHINCTWGGPGSASLAGPLFSNHPGYSLLYCGYSGPITNLEDGQSISTVITTTTDSAPSNFNNYAFTTGSIADTDNTPMNNSFNDLTVDNDYLDTISALGNNNFVLAAYTAPGGGDSSGSNSGGTANTPNSSGLGITGQAATIIIPLTTLLVSLVTLVWYAKFRRRNN